MHRVDDTFEQFLKDERCMEQLFRDTNFEQRDQNNRASADSQQNRSISEHLLPNINQNNQSANTSNPKNTIDQTNISRSRMEPLNIQRFEGCSATLTDHHA